MEKLLLMNVAAQLTTASCGGSNGLPISADLSDNNVRAKNLQAWETFRVFYHALVGAMKDNKSWPEPALDVGGLLPKLLQSVAPLLGSGPVKDVLDKLINLVPNQITLPSNPPLPLPGEAVPQAKGT